MPAPGPRAPSRARYSRRDLIRRLIGGALLVSGLAILKRVYLPSRIGSKENYTLEALLDVVIPGADTPGRRVSQILPRLVTELESRRQPRRGLLEGLALLERESRRLGFKDFASLPEGRRAVLFADCGREREGSVARYFYRIVRDGVMRAHYSSAEVWRPLGLPNPPQPDGYPDYAEAPRG